jgi:hypothetical protein
MGLVHQPPIWGQVETGTTTMIAANYDELGDIRSFRSGDTVRSRRDGETCAVIWTWGEWLWLDPIEYVDAAPYSGRAAEYDLVHRGMF